ncbi:condensation domain-containing protein [Undibacterium sp. TJN19]|uniref:condensation domain-containing protein n=1 Tax=Undibacterium sp. TJN19 TaxID=3413055 RepID=UPI003BF13E40
MTIAKLLFELEQLNVGLWVETDQLRFRAPRGVVSEEIRQKIALYKDELISFLGKAIQLCTPRSAQVPDAEDLPFTPNQAWYLNTFNPEEHSWANTLSLTVPWQLKAEAVQATMQQLLQQHDIFRLRFYRTQQGRWAQRMLADAEVSFITYDMTGLAQQDRHAATREAARQLEVGLSIVNGPVIAAALCDFGGADESKLLLSVSKHVVDGYSLQLLIAELLRINHAFSTDMQAGKDMQQPQQSASASYQQYLLALDEATSQPMFAARALSFWRQPHRLNASRLLPVDRQGGRHTDVNSRRVSVVLDAALLQRLTSYLRAYQGASFNDLVLFAISHAYHRWTGERSLRLDCESHGRGAVLPSLDLLATIGPTTIKFPLYLEVRPDLDQAAAFARLQASVRETMDNVLGYGFLRYTCADVDIHAEFAASPPPQVFLNNRTTLGSRTDSTETVDIADTADTEAPPKISVEEIAFVAAGAQENLVSYTLMIECDNGKDTVVLTCVYSSDIHHEETIRNFAQDCLSSLQSLVA